VKAIKMENLKTHSTSPVLCFSEEKYLRGLVSAGNAGQLLKFQEKLHNRQCITYGAIGGSITAGAAAIPSDNAYVRLFSAWLNSKTRCSLVNAGIGATTSMFGAFRAQKDLLKYQPDIITIEFAVNDVRNPDTAASFEWLVRQCVTQSNHPLVILLFTMFEDGSNMQDKHIPIGRHYGLPMLSYRDAVYPDIAAEKLAWRTISPDEVHPDNIGHRFIAAMLQRFIDGTIETHAKSRPEVIHYYNPDTAKYEGGHIADASTMDIIKNSGWTQCPVADDYTGLHSDCPGASLEIKFRGSLAVLGTKQYAGNFGRIAGTVDDGNPIIIDGFYEKPKVQVWAGGHIVLAMLGKSLSSAEHVIKIKLLCDKHPESNGHQFEIAYLLISGSKKDILI
jgi:lysophospholipase L1-like esterase